MVNQRIRECISKRYTHEAVIRKKRNDPRCQTWFNLKFDTFVVSALETSGWRNLVPVGSSQEKKPVNDFIIRIYGTCMCNSRMPKIYCFIQFFLPRYPRPWFWMLRSQVRKTSSTHIKNITLLCVWFRTRIFCLCWKMVDIVFDV